MGDPVTVTTDDSLTIAVSVTGDQAVAVSVVGEVDTVTAPRLAEVLASVVCGVWARRAASLPVVRVR